MFSILEKAPLKSCCSLKDFKKEKNLAWNFIRWRSYIYEYIHPSYIIPERLFRTNALFKVNLHFMASRTFGDGSFNFFLNDSTKSDNVLM